MFSKRLFCMNLYRQLLSFPEAGIWAFINETDKRIYLLESKNLMAGISRNIDAIQRSIHDVKLLQKDKYKLDVQVIEEVKDGVRRKVRLAYWMKRYKELGYSLYKEYKPVQYEVKVVLQDYIHVYLVSRRKKKILIGTFDKMVECDIFIETYYKDGVVDDVKVYKPN